MVSNYFQALYAKGTKMIGNKPLFFWVIFLVLLSASLCSAVDFTGSSSAVFGIPTPTEGKTYSGVGTNEFTNGNGYYGNDPTKVTLGSINFSTEVTKPFSIGQLTYFNGITMVGSTVDSVPVDLVINFSGPKIFSENFSFWFEFNMRPNTGGPDESDILIVHDVYSTKTFNVNNVLYELELLGFGNDAETIISEFELEELDTVQSYLWAEINVIPEPCTVIIFGLGGLTVLRRKKTAL